MTYIGRDLADEEDIELINANIDAILDILRMKGIIKTGEKYTDTYVDHWNVIEFRDDMKREMMKDE